MATQTFVTDLQAMNPTVVQVQVEYMYYAELLNIFIFSIQRIYNIQFTAVLFFLIRIILIGGK